MKVGQGSVDYWRKAQVDDGAIAICDVGRYAPNALGLRDMFGNVAELTESPWTDYGFEVDPTGSTRPSDKPGELERTERVVKGGSWKDWPERASASFRTPVIPYFRAADVGLRVVVAPKR